MSAYPIDAADDGEPFGGDPCNNHNDLWMITNDTTLLSHVSSFYALGSTEGLPQTWSQDQMSVPIGLQRNSDPERGVAHAREEPVEVYWPAKYVSPSALAMPGSQLGISPSFAEHDYGCPQEEARSPIPRDPSTHVFASGSYSDADDAHTHVQTANESAFAVSPSFNDQAGNDIGSDTHFIPGVLGRRAGHREALSVDTTRLMNVLCVSDNESGQMNPMYGTYSHANLDSRNGAMNSNKATIVPPHLPRDIHTQRSLVGHQQLHGMLSTEFQCIVREGTPVNHDLNMITSQSTQAASGRLHPHAVSPRSSEAPSPTSTATSTDGIGCPSCSSLFTGRWQKSNFNRHLRQKHAGGTIVQYRCEDDYCNRSFNRKDARLKHYRKAHPHLSSGPPVLRGSPSSARIDHVQGGHSDDSPLEGQTGFDEERLFLFENIQSARSYSV